MLTIATSTPRPTYTRGGDASALTLRAMLDEVRRRGLDPLPLLQRIGLGADAANDTLGRVPRGAVLAFCDAASQELHDRAMHVHAIVNAPFGHFGIVEYIGMMAPTVGLGLGRVAAAYSLVNAGLRVGVVVGERVARLVMEGAFEVEPHVVDVETCAVAIATRVRHATSGRHGPSGITFKGPDRGYGRLIERAAQCPVRFGAATDAIIFERAAWDARPDVTHPAVGALVSTLRDPIATAVGEASEGQSPLVAAVERTVQGRLRQGAASAHEVAHALGLSERTLHRRLADEGMRFGAIVDRLRLRLAETYLAARTTVSEVAELLGFSEASAFTRAYRRWTGRAPSTRRSACI